MKFVEKIVGFLPGSQRNIGLDDADRLRAPLMFPGSSGYRLFCDLSRLRKMEEFEGPAVR